MQVDARRCSDKSTKVDALKLSVISWNIEGFSRNFYTLFLLVNQYSAKLIFISEPQVYKCDLTTLIQPFIGSYDSYLNSEDVHDLELPLTYPRAKGGTMVMWHKSLSPHLKVLETSSSSYFSVLLYPLASCLPSTLLYTYRQVRRVNGCLLCWTWSSM